MLTSTNRLSSEFINFAAILILIVAKYGIDFPSIVNKENIYGLQFHPEKSSDQGLDIIKSFIKL